MKKINASLGLGGLALLSLMLCKATFAGEPPDNVRGDWTIYSTSIENGSTVVKHVQIAQYGNRITGSFEGPVQSGPIQGEVKGHHIRFSTVTRTVLNFRGQIYGDSMSGTYGIHGKSAPWQATRPATVAVAAPPSNGVAYQSQPVLAPPAPAPPVYYQAPVQQNNYSPAPAPAPQNSYYNSPPAPVQQNSYNPTPAPLPADQLNALVAPIALYPDALVAQVLAAAAFPEEVSAADEWVHQNSNLTGSVLAQAVDQQSWDPSVKALTQFSSVLDNLAKNLSWTSSLGEAYHFQQSDVMAAVQAMRAKAQAAGALQSSSQINVTQPAPNTIVIQPANPQVIYVPQYNPAIVYGAPLVVPFYTPPVAFAAASVTFGSGISIGAFFGGGGVVAGGVVGGFGWGFHAWNINWGCCGGGGNTTIVYNHNTYINNRTWNNNHYNGYHAWSGGAAGTQNRGYYGNNGSYHPNPGYHPGEDTHYGPNGGYHPNEYFGPNGGLHPDVPHSGTVPNGGDNGNHGLIGGNGGVQRTAQASPQRSNGELAQNRNDNQPRLGGAEQNRSRFSGDGAGNRYESNRGRRSMGGGRAEREPRMHEEHHSGGGRRR